ncbi:hypothetical protein [Chitinophaga sp. 212800010-3]|uniref:hypothetical protein n=1 Tax=unclassified Chitinophaga TaxID=2619133 RepID=UPI002DE67100|nr:hypothetical protein [Chitinophaga sp. 212800010-3]
MDLLSGIIYLLWFLSEILLHRLLRGGDASDKKKQDKGSLLIIWIVIIVFINISIIVSARTFYPILPGTALNRIGLAVIFSGMAFRFVSIAQLGRLI